MKLAEYIRRGVFLMDGAMGTEIQSRDIPRGRWMGSVGCNEVLNLSAPEEIEAIHRAYLEAGSDAVETNSFGASPITLGEYGLAERCEEINLAAARIARRAADSYSSPERPRFVFGSVGPGTRLPTLGQIGFDELSEGYRRQIGALLEGGADGILLETCQDLLQVKAGIVAFRAVTGNSSDIPLYVSVTVEQSGTMLMGSNMAVVVAVLAPLGVDILGLNCATGPEPMRVHLDYLAEHWDGLTACMPNAGLPIMDGERVIYPLGPTEFARLTAELARGAGLNVVGGCCGSTPAHIADLRRALEGYVPPVRKAGLSEQAASLYSAVDLTQEPPPLYIGERANATGSRRFREALTGSDYEQAFAILREQEEVGAHMLDLSCAYAGRDELADLKELVPRAARECRAPLMLDSTDAKAVESALKMYGGRMIINSINFEGGEEKALRIVEAARRFGAGLVCLTIDERGMAMEAPRKLEVAARLVDFCMEHGLRRGDLFVDCLTFTVASGDEGMRSAARETLQALELIKKELEGVRTLLGVSNVSYGLKPAARRVLNAVFLDMCLKRGLDACIINVAVLAPLTEVPGEAVRLAENLLMDDRGGGDPLEMFIRYFEEHDAGAVVEEEIAAASPEQLLRRAVVRGDTGRLEEAVAGLLEEKSAEEILNGILVPAMQEVGKLFDEGVLQLPFVLKSAEVMKRAVEILRPRLGAAGAEAAQGTLVLATVAGDVHDIGKNLVDIILSNNGVRVINLGTKVPVERMIEAVREHNADALGMSGLLVKSAAVMAENLQALEASGTRIPVLLGGAALTREFVEGICRRRYSGPAVYCKDAFDGLAWMRERGGQGKLGSLEHPRGDRQEAAQEGAAEEQLDLSAPPPAPPFWGWRVMEAIPAAEVLAFMNEDELFLARWKYRRGSLSREEHRRIIEEEARPHLERLKEEWVSSGRLRPKACCGYFRCRGHGDELHVSTGDDAEDWVVWRFPRQKKPPFRAIPDFFRRDEDVVALMVVTSGSEIGEECRLLMDANRYRDYYLLHGFGVEFTDALAEYVHKRIRDELGIGEPPMGGRDYAAQRYRGSRYAFGYSAAPDLEMNRTCLHLVHADEIGVTLTETGMMVPEMSTSALVVHHPAAKYFNV